MAQKPMMRADVYARGLRASQNLIRAEVWAATLRGRVVVAAVLAFAADAVLVAKHLLKPGFHLDTALARLHVKNISREEAAWRLGASGRKRAERSGET
jgi:hypothetical protein